MSNENTSRLEQYLQAIADGTGTEGLPVPQSRLEEIFLAMATGDASRCPAPQSRLEAFACACVGLTGGSAPDIAPLEITENGTYTAKDVDGYSPVTVNVADKKVIAPFEITENGVYTAEDVDGYSPVTVNVADKKVIVPLEATENGTYSAEGVDGYYPVTVNVAASGGAQITEFLASTTFTNEYMADLGAFAAVSPVSQETMEAWRANSKPVTVVYDGVEYTPTPQVVTGADGSDGVCVGNLSAFGGTGNGEPFAVVPWYVDGTSCFLIGSTVDAEPTEHTIRIYQEAGATTADQIVEGGVAEVVLPNATSIKINAFSSDKTLKFISMEKVTAIGNAAFQSCSNLETVSFPSVTIIGNNAFYGCTKLMIDTLPGSLNGIGYNSFGNCTKLTSLTFKSKPTGSISSGAFSGCTNLKTINVPWAEGEVAGAPWGATNATINYNYTGG